MLFIMFFVLASRITPPSAPKASKDSELRSAATSIALPVIKL
jgi:hypothetical protein